MPFLYITAAIIGLLLLLLHSRVYVTFAYRTDGGSSLTIDLSYLFFKLRLMPKKEKKVRIKDYSYKNLQKKKRREEKKTEKAKAKKAKKAAVKKKTAGGGSGNGNKEVSSKQKKKNKSVVSAILEIRDLLFDVISRFPGKFRLDVNRLVISVGGKDAAATAVTYGVVTEAVGALLTLLESGIRLRRGGVNDIMITPDYLSGRIDADVKIRLSIKPASVLEIAFRFIVGYVSKKIKQ